jgi:hypothetical protein
MAEIVNKKLLLAGDILLLKDEPGNSSWTHKMITVGQALTGANLGRHNRGSSSMVHAVIWTHTVGNNDAEIAEASGGAGRVRTAVLRPGYYAVFRPANANLGDWAAQVALIWAVGGTIAYGKSACIQSIAHSDIMGTNGKARAAAYTRAAFENAPSWGASGAFCSQFVLACYQAAAGQVKVPLTGALATDATHCSVRALHDRLLRESQNFRALGFLRIAGNHN